MMLLKAFLFFCFLSQAWSGTFCGRVEDFGGNLEILDGGRLHPQEVKPQILLPCGSWVSLKQGWVRIHHLSGAKIHAGVDTFFQLQASEKQHKLVLYHGEVFVDTSGTESLLLVSPQAQSWVRQAKVLMSVRDTTQLIALKNTACLENRLDARYQVQLHPGEFSILDLKLLRVTPSAPRVVSSSDLKWHLNLLQLKASDQQEAIFFSEQRKKQVTKSFLKNKPNDFAEEKIQPTRTKIVKRSIASWESSGWTEAEIEKSLLKHIAGDEPIEGVLHELPQKKPKKKVTLVPQKIKNEEEDRLLQKLAQLPAKGEEPR